jgi:outer membrane protein OmpA-like peptidoglycan-associated protein/tetratricopeptide (TPR) repeat protein
MKFCIQVLILSSVLFISSCKTYNSSIDIVLSTQKTKNKIKPLLVKENYYKNYDSDYSRIYNNEMNNISHLNFSDTVNFDRSNIGSAHLNVIKNKKGKGFFAFLICTAFGLPSLGSAAIVGLPIGHSKGVVKLRVEVKDQYGALIKKYKARARHFSFVSCYWGYKRVDAENKSVDRAFAKAMKKIKNKMDKDAEFLNSKLPNGFLNENEIAANKFIIEGNSNYNAKNYNKAIESYVKGYETLNSKQKKHAQFIHKLGLSYMYSDSDSATEKGISFLKKSLELDPKVDFMAPVGLYIFYKGLNDFTNGVKYLDYTLNNFNLNTQQISLIKEWKTNLQIEEKQITAGAELKKKPENVTVNNLGSTINGKEGDYFPSVTADESMLLFTSRRAGSTGGKDTDGNYDEDLWFSLKKPDGSWDAPQNFGSTVNTKNNNGIASFTGDGQYVVCGRCGETDGFGNCDIYGTTLTGYNWGKPVNLGSKINSSEWDAQSSISSDGKTLIWSSMRSGGFGNEDLWMSKKNEKGEWTTPKNLGSTVNTSGNEYSPFLHPDGKTLYFSSNNHNPRIGGVDIYKTTLNENGSWSTPVNLGYPINTEYNDLYFVLTPSGLKGYFASNRPGGQGNNDIYEIIYPQEKKSSLTTFIGNVMDEETKLPLEANIKIEDLDSAKLVGEYVSNSATGKCVVILNPGHNYSLTVSKNGYLFYSENFNIPANNEFKEVKKDVLLQAIKEGKKIVLNNIFFQTGKAELTETSIVELDHLYNLLNENPDIKVEISGHTDNVGNKADNLKLSQDRATVVVSALVKKGINSSRLTAKGYGDTQPIAPNDTDEHKQLNRRTEFKIINANK